MRRGSRRCEMAHFSDKRLLELLREFSLRHGKTPAARNAGKNGIPSTTTYLVRFGSWNKAILAAGLQPLRDGAYTGPNKYTEGELLAALRAFAQRLGYIPTANDMIISGGGGLPSLTTFKKRFGSLSRALCKSGMRYNRFRYISRSFVGHMIFMLANLHDRLRERVSLG
jgi:hypothetical protein